MLPRERREILLSTLKEQVLNVKIAKPTTAGTYGSVFDFCAGRCRHNSESVGLVLLSWKADCLELVLLLEGGQGESCDSVCKSSGQSCVLNKLILLNQCEIIQKYMSCKGGCLASMGADQPAEVADDAPSNLNPTACLYTRIQSMLSCDGSHRHTRRLCPCA
ncbi:hypothetical protein WN944_016167 [Citrus x changshan-huyou]|uniref:SREBP regulating gene protein n=1 Tax=Citrus x changshan-huyou TaxID=2935761 RepID=A0AAP0MD68_9ROSI